MKRFIAIAAALAAIVICSQGNAQAQTRLHPGGFPYPGSCCQQGFAGGAGAFGGFRLPREQPPYFAKFPPVYYSHVVKRPYGISPYAAQPGVIPVEMAFPKPESKPMVISNPFFQKDDESVIDAKVKTDVRVKTKAKPIKAKAAGWQTNPFFENQFVLLKTNSFTENQFVLN